MDTKNITLADLPVGTKAAVVRLILDARGSKKFADAGFVAGTEVEVEAHAPFGGLIRVRVMDCSMALHRNEAAGIITMTFGD